MPEEDQVEDMKKSLLISILILMVKKRKKYKDNH